MFAIVEVGSTCTKSSLYQDGKILELPLISIEFKKNYNQNNRIDENDKEKLYQYVNDMKLHTNDVYVYGTSIFRILKEEEKIAFLKEFKDRTGLDFNIVSPEEESRYTVLGAIANIEYDGNIAVMIGGGGSTEIAIVNNGKVIETQNLSFGVVDIIKEFPDTIDEITTTEISTIVKYIKAKMVDFENKADILMLAGGAHKMFREMVGYKLLDKVPFKYNKKELIVISKEDTYIGDEKYFKSIPLSDMRKKTPDIPKWWDGTRAMICFTQAVCDMANAKYIVSSNISMIYGIIEDKIKD